MDSASFEFVLFGLTAAVLSNFSRSSTWRSVVLFAASIVFLGRLANGLTVFLPLLGFLFFGYGCLLLLREAGLGGVPGFWPPLSSSTYGSRNTRFSPNQSSSTRSISPWAFPIFSSVSFTC